MIGALCHRQKKMMGRGADGGCGTEERLCRPISGVSGRRPVIQSETSEKQYDVGVDFFSQARKALCQRSPFDVPEGGSVSGLSVPTLPSGLASLLKQTDSRKKHKKSHSGADKKSSRQGEKAREASIWAETEVFFRDLALPDIDALFEIIPSRFLAARKKCFMIPYVGNELTGNSNLYAEVDEKASVSSGENFNGVNENGNVDKEGKEVVRVEDWHLMEIDSVATQAQFSPKETAGHFFPDSTSSLEWLLGSRSRILLSSERPSKKRKLVGEDAGLEKILVARPCDGDSSLCHFCCTGDTGKGSNRLIVCSSCKVAVHQKCYGVQKDVDSSWLCSWCELTNDGDGTVKYCVLCPKQGGALKPVQKNDENGSSVEFAHLFCSSWMPEVYIEDLTKMEPIINAGGINDTRKKLVCNVCKEEHGSLRVDIPPWSTNLYRKFSSDNITMEINRDSNESMDLFALSQRCYLLLDNVLKSNFTNAFQELAEPHSILYVQEKPGIEWKFGEDLGVIMQIELRAFCSKHSEIHDNSSSPQHGELCASGTDSSITNQLSLQSMDNSQNSKISQSNGDKIAVGIEGLDDKSGDGELQEIDVSGTRSNTQVASECSEAQHLVDVGLLERTNDDEHSPFNSLNFAMILKKLIDRGKVNVKDIASEIGLSADSLSASLNVIPAIVNDSLAPDLQCKIVKWLSNHAYMGTSLKNLKVNIKSLISSKDETDETGTGISDDIMASKSDIADVVAVKPMPPWRRTKNNVRILRDNKILCSSDEATDDIGVVMDEVRVDLLAKEETNDLSKISILDATGR
ncbi:hypothetical protein Goarm_020671, partial [Gossypium armourianum]|nr:hypothetical protein [Gossypium armourianum]